MKTNAMRLLDRLGIACEALPYDTSDGLLDGVSVAHKTAQDVRDVFKTLVCRGAGGGVYVFCIPVAEELDLKRAARAVAAAGAREKNIALLPVAQLLGATGYKKGGCSPLGMKKPYPVFIDASALEREWVLISAGRIGLQIRLRPQDLIRAAEAEVF